MLGSVLAIVNRSARSRPPSAATSSALRMKPEAREKTVPAAITAEDARIRWSDPYGFLSEADPDTPELCAKADIDYRLAGDEGAISSVLLRVDPELRSDIERRLRESPQVIDVSDARGDMQRLREMNASFIDIWTVVSIALSASVLFGVSATDAGASALPSRVCPGAPGSRRRIPRQ